MSKICFDLRALQIGHEHRGIGMYIKSVLEHLPASDNEYIIYAFDKNNPVEAVGLKLKFKYQLVQTPSIKTTLHSPKDLPGLLRLINHRFRPLRSVDPDVFVQFDFTLGVPRWKKVKKIVIGYDLIPLIMKNQYLPSLFFAMKQTAPVTMTPMKLFRSLWFRITHASFAIKRRPKFFPSVFRAAVRSSYYNFKYKEHYKTFKRASQIICISEATAADFVKLLGIEQRKIHAIPLAPVLPSSAPDFSTADKIKNPFLFYIGGTDSRKKIQDIVQAFNIARGRGVKVDLVLAGNEFSKLEHIPSIEGRNAILASPYKKYIHLVGFVSDEQKMGLYQKAFAFIFCTIYEGFGLPIIEAMSMSCPVISYNNSSIPEAAGEAAILVQTGDYTATAKSIQALQDSKLREELIAAGLHQAKKFSWQKTINQMMAIIEDPA